MEKLKYNKKVEILAPVGDMDSFYSSINNGADAIYVAGKNFGARAFATNFENEELQSLIPIAHSLGVKVYVTINTIIKESEINDVISFVDFLVENSVDAIIIQDLGLIHILSNRYPDLTLHASTQMNTLNVSQAKELKDLGIKRIILARETSFEQVKEIIDNVDIEVEVFVHGALCMCYSGNCYLSSMIGGRSGNRGRCAQPCRLNYTLSSSKEDYKKKYYLSPRDLCSLDKVRDLKEIGIDSLKIEGRMKGQVYSGLTSKYYKLALKKKLTEGELTTYKENLATIFNRKFSEGFLFNCSNKKFTNVATSNHIGIVAGTVVDYANNYAFIKLKTNINQFDGLRIIGEVNDAIIVNNMFVNGKVNTSAKENDVIQVRTHKKVAIDSTVLKTSDALLKKEIEETKDKKISLSATLFVNEKVCLIVSDSIHEVMIESSFPVTLSNNPNTKKRIIEQLNKTNDTCYYFSKVEVKDDIFLPIKDINSLRREALLLIDQKRKERTKLEKHAISIKPYKNDITKRMFIKVRTKEQLLYALERKVKDIIVDEVELLNIAKEYGNGESNITFMNKRISKNVKFKDEISSVYNNVINSESVRFLQEQGANIVGLSIEASKEDIIDIIDSYKAKYGETPNVLVMVYGYYELMIMKHCLICKEKGHSEKGCGECFKDRYSLVDRKDEKYPLICDSFKPNKECNLLLLNSKPLSLYNKLEELYRIGVNNFLVDITIEEDYEEIIDKYIETFEKISSNRSYKKDMLNDEYSLGHYDKIIE